MEKLVLLRLHITGVMISNARSASLLRDTRLASLLKDTNAKLIESAFLKCRQINATISNARFASLLSRGTRLAFQNQNARAASVLQNVSSASLNPASWSYDTRLIFALQQLRSVES